MGKMLVRVAAATTGVLLAFGAAGAAEAGGAVGPLGCLKPTVGKVASGSLKGWYYGFSHTGGYFWVHETSQTYRQWFTAGKTYYFDSRVTIDCSGYYPNRTN